MDIKTPVYILKEKKLKQNLQILQLIQKQSGAKILLALKGFAFQASFELVSKYLQGCCSSGLHEAKLAKEDFCKFGNEKEVHTYSPAFKEDDIDEILFISDHVVFNSFSQWKKYKKKAINQASCGLRVNPQIASSVIDIYNPCSQYSRLGIIETEFKENSLEGIQGLHFHTLCEQNVDALEDTLKVFEQKFGFYIKEMKWINFGGGHHITRDDYDVQKLIKIIKDFSKKYNVQVYLEPGAAIGWQSGVLVSTVLDVVYNEMDIAILDTSAEAHMPDSLIIPYRVEVTGADKAYKKPYTYRLAGNTCLAGDIMGDYSFDKPLKVGDKVIFEDQMHYTIVKNTTFNGIKLPDLAIQKEDGTIEVVKKFGYNEYKRRN